MGEMDRKTKKVLNSQYKKLSKKEQRLLREKPPSLLQKKIAPTYAKLEEKIPPKLKDTLDAAFEKGFVLVFEKGTSLIEKSLGREKLVSRHAISRFTLEKEFSKKNLKKLQGAVNTSLYKNKGISTVEGAVLGVLGIGLPDIPLFISVILKTIYETALNYGFDYTSPSERIFILHIISAAVCKGEKQAAYYQTATQLGFAIDQHQPITPELNQTIKETAQNLSDCMLTAKFIQGIPLVGTVGSIFNYRVVSSVTRMASIHYERRFLSGFHSGKQS